MELFFLYLGKTINKETFTFKLRLTGCTSSYVEETKYPVIAGSCKGIPVRPWLKGNAIDIIWVFE